MKAVLFTVVLIGLGIWGIVALSHTGGDLSYSSSVFSVDVAQADEKIKTSVESGEAVISFSLDAPNATKRVNGTKTIYEISDATTLEYEVLKGATSGLKETIILNKKSAPNEYSFSFSLKGIKDFRPDPDKNTWHFFDSAGKEIFYIPAGYMVDGSGERSDAVPISITKDGTDYVLKVTADKKWLSDPERAYPVRIDPSVVVSGGIVAGDAQFGSMQRKITYVNGNWYAFYSDAGSIFYKKSSNGTSWGSAVEIDGGDSDNYNPTVWLEGSLIYVSWIEDTDEAVEINTINTASSDALGTACSSDEETGQTTVSSSIMTSIAVADNGTVYVSYSDTSTGDTFGLFQLTFSGCDFTIIGPPVRVPEGVVVGWPSTAGTIPSGWTRYTGMDDRFSKNVASAATEPGNTGGATTHTHTTSSHDHSVDHGHPANGTTGASNSTTSYGAGGLAISLGNHTHSFAAISSGAVTSTSQSPTSDSDSNNPAYLDVIWIESDGSPTGIPSDAIAYFNSSSLPSNWSQTTNAKDAFLKGAAAAGDGGGTGGAATHSHAGGSHSHTANHSHGGTYASGPGTGSNNGASGTGATSATTHTHNITISSNNSSLPSNTISSSTDNQEPPWYKQAIIENDGSPDLPTNIIVLYTGAIADIPGGWIICDGNNGTPNLLGKYIKGANLTSEIGNTGGSTTHSHTGSNHTHTMGSHSHGLNLASTSTANDRTNSGANSGGTINSHGHVSNTGTSGGTTPTASNQAPNLDVSSNEPAYYETVPVQFQGGDYGGGASEVLVTIGNDLHVVYQDSGFLSHAVYNGSSWTVESVTIARVADTKYSITTDGTNLWVLTISGTTSTSLYQYNGSSWSTKSSPWREETNMIAVSLTYDSGGGNLYAAAIKDANEQAYWIRTKAAGIAWIDEHELGFTPGDLGELSMPLTVTSDSLIRALLRQGSNLEVNDASSGPPAVKQIRINGGTKIRGGTNLGD